MALIVENELQLKEFITLLEVNNIGFCAFYEPDLNNELTAVATEVIYNGQRKLFKKYRCFK